MFNFLKRIHPLSYIVFLLPVYLIKFKIGFFSINLLEIFFFLLFLWWIYYVFFKKNLSPIFKQKSLLFLGIFLILVGACYASLISQDILKSLGIFKSWVLLPVLFFIILITTEPDAKQVLKSFHFSGLSVASISLIYLVAENLTYDNRLSSFYLHPNHLAMYLAPCWLISLSFLLFSKENKKRFLWLTSLLVISLALFFTFSYGAWIGVLLGGLMFTWQNKKFNKKIILSILLFLIILSGSFCHPKFQNIFTTERSSLHSRIMIWRSALHMLKDNWIAGIGPGMFQKTYLNYQKFFSPYLEWAVPQPHNIFLAFWLQAGIIGLIGFVIVLAWFFRQIYKILKQNKKEAWIASVCLSLMIYTLVHGLVDTTYWKNDLSIIFWLIVGILVLKSQAIKSPVQFINKK